MVGGKVRREVVGLEPLFAILCASFVCGVKWRGEERERWSESESGVTFGVVLKVLDLRVEILLCGRDIRYTLWVWLKLGINVVRYCSSSLTRIFVSTHQNLDRCRALSHSCVMW